MFFLERLWFRFFVGVEQFRINRMIKRVGWCDEVIERQIALNILCGELGL